MVKILKDDRRYALLEKMPQNQGGVVTFRKKKGNKFVMAVIPLQEGVTTVLYKLRPEETGNAQILSFEHLTRN
jgi:hypothetical protein